MILHSLSGDDKRLLKAAGQKFLAESPQAAHIIVSGSRLGIACSSSDGSSFNAKAFMDRMFSELGGKGGGNPTFAQGVLQNKTITDVQKWLQSLN